MGHKRKENKEMTFNQAYKYAMEHSEVFRKHDARVKEAQNNRTQSTCLIFSVEPHETFYYGFDGVDLHRGKHTRQRAARLFEREEALIIL